MLRPTLTRTALALSLTLLAACSSDDDDDESAVVDEPVLEAPPPPSDAPVDPGDGDTFAFVAAVAPDFGSARIERLRVGDTVETAGTYPATLSDITVRTDGRHVYEIGRFQIDSITKYSPTNLEQPEWQYSVLGDESNANPYDLVFASETKAYVLRYGSPEIWIVDPSATTEDAFLQGTIDLGAYDEDAPNAVDGVIVGDRLFVLLQRIDESGTFAPDSPGYVAVIDTATDTEVETGQGEGGLPGIALQGHNAQSLQYVESLGELYVTSIGNFFGNEEIVGDPYLGGIETIDAETYEAGLLVDDGTAESNVGFFANSLVLSPDTGYVLTYADFGNTTLRRFTPATGALDPAPVATLESRDLTTLVEGPDGLVWIGEGSMTAATPGFERLDPATGELSQQPALTGFNPRDVVFVNVPAE